VRELMPSTYRPARAGSQAGDVALERDEWEARGGYREVELGWVGARPTRRVRAIMEASHWLERHLMSTGLW